MAIYDLEESIKQSNDFNNLCIAVFDEDLNKKRCMDSAINSPLNLLEAHGYYSKYDLINAELNQEDLNDLLKDTINDEDLWANYSKLFDKSVSA